MKCPFRMKALDHPDACDTDCAWFLSYASGPFIATDERFGSCAVAVLAQGVDDEYGIPITKSANAKLAGDEVGR